jgi:hypothetical protein
VGRLLVDEKSLSFYGIRSDSQIYCCFRSPLNPRQNPKQQLNRLYVLLDKLPEADSRHYTELESEIRWVIDNPLVQSLFRIDSNVKHIICNAEVILNNTQRPSSRRTRTFRAKVQDAASDQINASPETTKLRPARKICELPLANPWAKRDRSVLYSSVVRMSVGSPAPY